MAVVKVERAAASASGTWGRGNERKYVANYNVSTDDPADGPSLIAEYLSENGFQIGSTYSYGSDNDEFSFLSGITPSRKQNSLTEWLVAMTYEPLDRQQGDDRLDADGNPTSDPLLWELALSISTSVYQVPVWGAWNVDQLYARNPDTFGAVTNSAMVPMDPPLMRNVSETSISFSGNVAQGKISNVSGFVNALNSFSVAINPIAETRYALQAVSFQKHTLKCTGASHTFRRQNGVPYWELAYEVKYREPASSLNPQDRWYESVLDRGIARRAAPGDPDGLGGSYSLADDPPDGVATVTPVRDRSGNRVPEMVLLDGNGQPAPPGSPGVFIRWRLDREVDYTIMPFGLFV